MMSDRLVDTLRAKINEHDEVLDVIKTAPENKGCESYPRILSDSLEIGGIARGNSKSKKTVFNRKRKERNRNKGKIRLLTTTRGSCSLRVMSS